MLDSSLWGRALSVTQALTSGLEILVAVEFALSSPGVPSEQVTSIRQPDPIRADGTVEPDCRDGDAEVRSELLRLRQRMAG